jgi:hypothetical protein
MIVVSPFLSSIGVSSLCCTTLYEDDLWSDPWVVSVKTKVKDDLFLNELNLESFMTFWNNLLPARLAAVFLSDATYLPPEYPISDSEILKERQFFFPLMQEGIFSFLYSMIYFFLILILQKQ